MNNDAFTSAMKEIRQRHDNAVNVQLYRENEIRNKSKLAAEVLKEISMTGAKVFSVAQSGINYKEKVQQLIDNNLMLQKKMQTILKENGYPVDYLDIHYFCKKCEDTGYVGNAKCDCLKKLIGKYNVKELHSSCPVIKAKFEDLDYGFYSHTKTGGRLSPFEVMSANIKFCKEYAASFYKHSESVMMLGETGLGKTHLSCAIADAVAEKGYNVLYVSAPDIFRKLQSEYYGNAEGVSTIDILFDVDLLIIDDLGSEIQNQLNVSLFYNIVNTRLNYSKPIIINTNLTLKEIESRYSDRIVSRLFSSYKCLTFIGRDIRQQKMKSGK